MLAPGQSPFPDNPVCKRCITKPCHRLFAGRVWAGKMIFVRHNDFKFLPCYNPQLKKPADDLEEQPALTDDIEVITGNIEITNPRWQSIEEAVAGGDPEIPFMGDTVRLLADVKNYANGAPVLFDVYDVTDATPLRIASVSGTNDNGTAKATWTVEDPQKRGSSLKLSFEAGARSKYTQRADLPWQDKIKCDFIEIPDVLFHHKSAVPCLDEKGSLVATLGTVFTFTKDNPDKEIMLYGHTDTSGDPAYNYDLSQWRAEAIKALLDNNSDAWLDTIDLASKVEDYQAILTTLSQCHGWSCDPGVVDNTDGPTTKAAIKIFQQEYNERYKASLTVDGVIGSKTWSALFAVIRSIIQETVKQKTGDEKLPALIWGYEGKGIYACGESFPIDNAEKDNYASQTNRRVELVFFDKGKVPALTAPSDKKKVDKKEAPVYDARKTVKKKIPVATVNVEQQTPTANDELILFDPVKNEYWELTEPADIDALITEAEYMNDFAQEIQNAFNLPTVKEQCIAAQKNRQTFESILDDKPLAKGQRILNELLAVKTNPRFGERLHSMVYIRSVIQDRKGKPVTIHGHWRKHTKEYMEKRLKEFLKLDEASKNKPEYKTKAIFWKKEYDNNTAFRFTTGALKGGDIFSAGAEAQFLRFTAGASVNSSLDLKKGTVKLGCEGNVTFSLAEGKVYGRLRLPDNAGCNILELFTSNDKLAPLVKQGRTCFIRIAVELNGYAFVGASATAFVGLPNIDFSKDEKKGTRKSEVQVGAEGAAGVTATAGVALGAILAWNGGKTIDWSDLGEVTGRAEASAGIGVSTKLKVEYKDGKFRFEVAAGAVVGLGSKGSVEIEIDVKSGFDFLAHILNSFDYHYVKDISAGAFDALVRTSVAQITDVAEIAQNTALHGKQLVLSAFGKGMEYKQKMVVAITGNHHEENLKAAVPEASSAIILGIMETPQEQDFDAILTILRPMGYHELKSVLRLLSERRLDRKAPDYGDLQGKALQEGVRRLMEFGGYFEISKDKKNVPFIKEIQRVLNDAKIIHDYNK